MYARFLKRKSSVFIVALLALAPFTALADVSFTEIMYDSAGADTGHEWVEIQNTGSDAVSALGWKFSEGGVNHKLIAQRSSVIGAGEYAIIANNAEKFSADYPAYAGALFQSSFSLSNTGETFALKNASSTELASATYASAAGASGDGNTLNFVNGSWVVRRPSPGSAASATAVAKPVATAAPVSTKSTPKSVSKGNPTPVGAVSTASQSAAAAQADAATGSTSFGILPWIFGLFAVILAGTAAVFMIPRKKPQDEYTIIEDES